MTRLFGKLSVLLYLAVALASCESDPIIAPVHNDTTIVTNETRALYVLNEGAYGANNASLDVLLITRNQTIIDSTNRKDTIVTFDTLYQKNRIPGLGDVGNDLKLINGQIYAVMNNSNEIVVVDPANASEVKRINFSAGSGPNKIANIGGNRALVTHLYSTELAIVDVATNTIAGAVNLGRTSNDIGVLNNKAFISADTQSVVIWDIASNSIDTVITVPYGPQQIYVDSVNDQIIVACQGNFADAASTSNLVYIDASTGAILKTEQVGIGVYAIGRLMRGPAGKLLMLTSGQVQTINLSTRTIASVPLITSPKQYYGGGYDAQTNTLYLGDAAGFTGLGAVDVYDAATGALLKSYEAGIAPAHFAFYR
jgi:hypothetical protein